MNITIEQLAIPNPSAMTTPLLQTPPPKTAKVINNLTWEQWEDGTLAIYHLSDGTYQRVNQRELLKHLPLDVFCRYITYYDQHDAVQEFRQAIRQGSEAYPAGSKLR